MKLVYEQGAGSQAESIAGSVVRELARHASIEATPGQIAGAKSLPDMLPEGTSVYVPFLPKSNFDDTVTACRRLLAAGMLPVPHFPARAIASRTQARDWLSDLYETGVNRLMLIAGDRDQAAGPFNDTLSLLDSGLLVEYEFYHLGIAGHPEGHPVADEDELRRAMAIKRDYAAATATDMWIVTQFAFETTTVIRWLQSMQDVMNPLPVYFGIAGPTKLRTLIAYAAQCGVGVSARVMRRKPSAARLLRAWTPDGLVSAMAQHRNDNPASLFRGIHLFPFGGLERTSEWLRNLRDESDQPATEASQSGL